MASSYQSKYDVEQLSNMHRDVTVGERDDETPEQVLATSPATLSDAEPNVDDVTEAVHGAENVPCVVYHSAHRRFFCLFTGMNKSTHYGPIRKTVPEAIDDCVRMIQKHDDDNKDENGYPKWVPGRKNMARNYIDRYRIRPVPTLGT
jgi:hypothetical protein